MAEPVQGEAVWKFAIMFQTGMIVVGVVLAVIAFVGGRSIIPGIFGLVLIGLGIAGIIYARKNLRELRQ